MFDFLVFSERECSFYTDLLRHLRRHRTRCSFRLIPNFPVPRGSWRKPWPWRPPALIIQDRRSGQFWVLDEDDQPVPKGRPTKAALSDPRCQSYLKSQYDPVSYSRYPYTKVRPWTYFECSAEECQPIVDELRAVERTRRQLYFRGWTSYANRARILNALRPSGFLEHTTSKLEYVQYLRECSQYKLALSLPGHGNLCNREIEAFGIGTAVLMPRHKHQLHDPLIPDYHYVSVPVDTKHDSPLKVARAIEARYHQVIDQPDYLHRIARNAIAWYEQNVRYPAALDLTARLLGILPKVDRESRSVIQ